jgi:hypothetical protein
VQLGPAKRLTAQNTQLGWILGGCWDTNKENTKTICTFSSKNLEKQMVKFWQIEEIDHKPILSREHERCEKQFLECHKRLANGKLQVPLMFKSESPNIGLSFDQALKRFQSQTDSDRWYHVKGEENLADIISRGLLPSQLRNSKIMGSWSKLVIFTP